MSSSNIILSGGPGHHPYSVTSDRLRSILSLEGIKSDVTDDIEDGLAELAAGRYGMLTVNALRWRMDAPKYAAERAEWAFSLSDAGRAAIRDHIARGGSLLAVHTATICFDDWPEWGDIVGAHWVWGTSGHPDLGPVRVEVRAESPSGDTSSRFSGTIRHQNDARQIVEGAEDFATVDEVYANMAVRPDVNPLATAHWEGTDHPLLWAREVGPTGARVVYDALGHDERSYDNPVHQQILRQAARWLCEGLTGEGT